MQHSRIERVAMLIKEELGEIIDRKLQNPLIPDFVTIHSVKVAKDLSVADVQVTFLEDDDPHRVEEAIGELRKSAKFIRGELARRVKIKYLPALKFHYNASTRYAADLSKILHQIGTADHTSDPADEPSENENN